MDIKDNFGLKPVKEKFNLNEEQPTPLYMRNSSYGNHKEIVGMELKGVLNADKVYRNKSDYTQRGEE